jgi:hypothetical protein
LGNAGEQIEAASAVSHLAHCRGCAGLVELALDKVLGKAMKLYFDDEAFDGQLQRSVGKSDSGMANVGECLAIGDQITQ